MRNKVILVKKPDGGIIKIMPNLEKYGDGKIPFSDCKSLQKYIDKDHPEFDKSLGICKYFIVDVDDIPKCESWKQLYFDDNDKLSIDDKWEKKLMPSNIIAEKYFSKMNKKIDDLLSDKNCDILELIKTNRNVDKLKSDCSKSSSIIESEHIWYTQALANLDEKVKSGESDKPVIREKLQKKINELSKKLEV